MINRVKITSGKYRGRSIQTPGGTTHPMGERERLALFNMISEYLPGAELLDAFAGSGALGIEAISRGAKKVVFIEKNAKACQVIRKNLVSLGIEAEVFQGDVVNFTTPESFGLILADPPYDNFDEEKIIHLLKFLDKGRILVLSHPDKSPVFPEMELLKTRKYAGANISIYIKR